MKLLVEDISQSQFDCEARTENGEKHYYLKGLFLQGNSKNRNGRIYPVNVLEKAVKDYQKLIDENVSLGEIRHPKNPEDAASIDYENVTHMIKKVWKEGDNYFAEALILDTPKGKIIQELLKAGAKIGVSSRGMGSVIKENDALVVQDDYRIIALADLTSNPSAYGAMNSAVYESAEYEYDELTGEFKLMSDVMTEKKECDCKQGKDCECGCKQGEDCKCVAKEEKKEEKKDDSKAKEVAKESTKESQEVVEEATKEEKQEVEQTACVEVVSKDDSKAKCVVCYGLKDGIWQVIKAEGDESMIKAIKSKKGKMTGANTPATIAAHIGLLGFSAHLASTKAVQEEVVVGTIEEITESQIRDFKSLLIM